MDVVCTAGPLRPTSCIARIASPPQNPVYRRFQSLLAERLHKVRSTDGIARKAMVTLTISAGSTYTAPR